MVVLEAHDRKDEVHHVLQYLGSSLFYVLDSLKENPPLCPMKYKELGEWMKVTKCQRIRESLSVVFWKVPLRFMEAFGVKHLSRPTAQGAKDDETREVVTGEVAFETVTSVVECFREGSVMFFEKKSSEIQTMRNCNGQVLEGALYLQIDAIM